MSTKKKKGLFHKNLDVLVVGGGSFGTALANILAGLKRKVKVWVRREEQAREINEEHTNKNFYPNVKLHKNLAATTDLESHIQGTKLILMAVPTKCFREVAKQIGDYLEGDQDLIHVTKGIEQKTFKRMSEILKEETCALKIGALAGPNLAKELILGHPAGALVASHFDEVVLKTQEFFKGGPLRVYGGRDIVGTEIGGAFKNIIAIAAGVVAGMGFGDNTKALLITRGLSEMTQFGVAQGAEVLTFGGLAGIGDLMATCASSLSRNNQVGQRLGKGEKLEDILASMNEVAEGVPTTKAVYEEIQGLQLKLPIVEAVYHLLYKDWTTQQALTYLMEQPTGLELARLHV